MTPSTVAAAWMTLSMVAVAAAASGWAAAGRAAAGRRHRSGSRRDRGPGGWPSPAEVP